jgi:hypothetical protein
MWFSARPVSTIGSDRRRPDSAAVATGAAATSMWSMLSLAGS